MAPLPPPKPLKIKLGKGSEKSLCIGKTRVERAITKRKPLFALFMVESNISEVVKPLHPPTQLLLREFEDVLPNNLPSRLPLFRQIEHQINLLLGDPLLNKPSCRCNPNELKELQ